MHSLIRYQVTSKWIYFHKFNEKKNEESQEQNYMKSEGIKAAEVESDRIRNYVKSEVEAFVSNIPYTFLAKDLVGYLASKLKSLGEWISHCW